MSAATLVCQARGHGLSFETRGGHYQVSLLRSGTAQRTINFDHVEGFDLKSRTAQRLEQLFEKYRDQLDDLNIAYAGQDETEYRRIYWDVRNGLKGD